MAYAMTQETFDNAPIVPGYTGRNFFYRIINGTSYSVDTPKSVVEVLEYSRQNRVRIRVFLGDPVTGRDWLDVWGSEGTVSRSTGNNKIPLLIHNSRSMGAPALLDNNILKIITTKGKRVLYQADNYQAPSLETANTNDATYPVAVTRDGEEVARFRNEAKAKAFIKKARGE